MIYAQVERKHHKKTTFLLKGEAVSVTIRPDVRHAEHSPFVTFVLMLAPGSDDMDNLMPHLEQVDMLRQIAGLTFAPFDWRVGDVDARVAFRQIWVPDQKGAASIGGTGGPVDVNAPDPSTYLKLADFGLPHGKAEIYYRPVSENFQHVHGSTISGGHQALIDAQAARGGGRSYMDAEIEARDRVKIWRAGGHAVREIPQILHVLDSTSTTLIAHGAPGADTRAFRQRLEREEAAARRALELKVLVLRGLGSTTNRKSTDDPHIQIQIPNEKNKQPLKVLRAECGAAAEKLRAALDEDLPAPLLGKRVRGISAGLQSVYTDALEARYTASMVPLESPVPHLKRLVAKAKAIEIEIKLMGFSITTDLCSEDEGGEPINYLPLDNEDLRIAIAKGREFFAGLGEVTADLENTILNHKDDFVTRRTKPTDRCEWNLGELVSDKQLEAYEGADGFAGIQHLPYWPLGSVYRFCALHVVILRGLGTVATRELTLAEHAVPRAFEDPAQTTHQKLTLILYKAKMLATAPFKKSQKHIRQLDGPMAINGLLPLETWSAFPEAKGTRIKIELMHEILKGLVPLITDCYEPDERYGETADRLADDVDALTETLFKYLYDTTYPTVWSKRGRQQPGKSLSLMVMSVQIPILYRATGGRYACISAVTAEKKHQDTKDNYRRRTRCPIILAQLRRRLPTTTPRRRPHDARREAARPPRRARADAHGGHGLVVRAAALHERAGHRPEAVRLSAPQNADQGRRRTNARAPHGAQGRSLCFKRGVVEDRRDDLGCGRGRHGLPDQGDGAGGGRRQVVLGRGARFDDDCRHGLRRV